MKARTSSKASTTHREPRHSAPYRYDRESPRLVEATDGVSRLNGTTAKMARCRGLGLIGLKIPSGSRLGHRDRQGVPDGLCARHPHAGRGRRKREPIAADSCRGLCAEPVNGVRRWRAIIRRGGIWRSISRARRPAMAPVRPLLADFHPRRELTAAVLGEKLGRDELKTKTLSRLRTNTRGMTEHVCPAGYGTRSAIADWHGVRAAFSAARLPRASRSISAGTDEEGVEGLICWRSTPTGNDTGEHVAEQARIAA